MWSTSILTLPISLLYRFRRPHFKHVPSQLSPRRLANAICRPSGDQDGLRSGAGSSVRLMIASPPMSALKISALPSAVRLATKAIRPGAPVAYARIEDGMSADNSAKESANRQRIGRLSSTYWCRKSIRTIRGLSMVRT